MINTILVAIDGSDHSKRALELACEFADKHKAELHLLHVPQMPNQNKTMVLGGATVTLQSSQAEIERAGQTVLEAARELAGQLGCEEASAQVVAGDPAHRIVNRALDVDADMIVMGRRGLSELAGLMVGSVSHKVSHLAPCACLTVR